MPKGAEHYVVIISKLCDHYMRIKIIEFCKLEFQWGGRGMVPELFMFTTWVTLLFH